MKRALFLAAVCLCAVMVFAPVALAQDETTMVEEETVMQEETVVTEDTPMAEETTPMAEEDLPESGGPAILLPAAALLLGSGILTYAVLRRR